IPVSQSSVMDDIEECLCADVKGDATEEGVSSEGMSVPAAPVCVIVPVLHPKPMSLCLVVPAEFDRFLEERAKAADSASPPPGAHPAHPARAPGGSHKKAERTEDTLFAL
ncbi:unnamed protein product, partial [Tetraodon nigroviridis]